MSDLMAALAAVSERSEQEERMRAAQSALRRWDGIDAERGVLLLDDAIAATSAAMGTDRSMAYLKLVHDFGGSIFGGRLRVGADGRVAGH